jgi:hypothetical protein
VHLGGADGFNRLGGSKSLFHVAYTRRARSYVNLRVPSAGPVQFGLLMQCPQGERSEQQIPISILLYLSRLRSEVLLPGPYHHLRRLFSRGPSI